MLQKNKILKFLLSGGLAAATEYSIFLLLSSLEVGLVIANSLSFLSGLIVSFSLNRTLVFVSSGSIMKQFIAYFTLAIINLILSNVLVVYLTESQNLDQRLAKIVIMVLVAAWNYIIFGKLIFRNRSTN